MYRVCCRALGLSAGHRAANPCARALRRRGSVGGGGGAMRRWLPHPLLAVMLLLAWLLLQQSLAPGTVVLGSLLALGLCLVLEQLEPPRVRLRRMGTMARLLL